MAADDHRTRDPPQAESLADTVSSGEHLLPEARPMPAEIGGERYQMMEVLGRGGMGEVRKAFDPRLNRHVAVKLMRNATPVEARRLVHEARAQARVEHPNVCKVYGVGELDGMPFIALQYIDGETLKDAGQKMTREEKVKVVRDVADALHAAHRQGLVHRDVKPANVLVERTDGGFIPYVTDFGIARDVDAPGLTRTGVAQGTPLYMAPEQARGDAQKIDRRTDVYALGVVLYELLAGRRPFEAETSLTVILKLLHEEPPPLRSVDSSIPVDLETVTMKCLEKDPVQRYDSARALAEDLQAWLDGEPIRARRAGLTYVVRKWMKRHVALLGAVGAVLVTALTLGGYAWKTRRSAAEQARLGQEFGQEVERMDAIGRFAALLPLHDTRREREAIAARMATLKARMSELGAVADGPGHYALGRGYLALERPAEARRELEQSFQAGYRTPELSYSLGLAFGELYQAALSELERGDASAKEQRRAELERTLREPALAYLKMAAGAHVEAPEYVEGLLALNERRYDDAARLAQAAQGRVPWLYEAHTLEGDVHFRRAREHHAKSELDAALDELEQAGRAYRAAAAIAHSSVSALRGDCQRALVAAEILADRDRSPEEMVKAALAACSTALEARPDDASLFGDEADAWMELARYQGDHDVKPEASWSEALRLGHQAVQLDGRNVHALLAVARSEEGLAEYHMAHGDDPRAGIERAIAAARSALAVEPRSFEALTQIGSSWNALGDWQANHGLDPRTAYDAAIEYAKKGSSLAGAGFKNENAVGLGYLSKGMWEAANGQDPRQSLEQAVASYEKVVHASPNVDYGYLNLCATWQTLGEYESRRGVDPMASFGKAIAACERGIGVDPNWPGSHLNLGCAHYDVAMWQLQNRLDPTAQLELARASMKRAFGVDSKYELAFRSSGDIEVLAARWAASHGQAAEPYFSSAGRFYEQALEQNPNDADVLRGLAELHRYRAEWRAAHHQPVDDDVTEGLERAGEALAKNARLGTAAMQAGALHLIAARQRPSVREREARDAQAALEQALTLNAHLQREAQPLLDEAKQLATTK